MRTSSKWLSMEIATFQNNSLEFVVTDEMKESFRWVVKTQSCYRISRSGSGWEKGNVLYSRVQGYILVRKLFDDQEMNLLWECFNTDQFRSRLFTRSDGGQHRHLNISDSNLLAQVLPAFRCRCGGGPGTTRWAWWPGPGGSSPPCSNCWEDRRSTYSAPRWVYRGLPWVDTGYWIVFKSCVGG